MAQNRAGLSVAAVLSDARSEDFRADQGADPADHMHGGGSGKIMETHFGQPAAAPDPVAGNRVDKKRDRGGVDAVG